MQIGCAAVAVRGRVGAQCTRPTMEAPGPGHGNLAYLALAMAGFSMRLRVESRERCPLAAAAIICCMAAAAFSWLSSCSMVWPLRLCSADGLFRAASAQAGKGQAWDQASGR